MISESWDLIKITNPTFSINMDIRTQSMQISANIHAQKTRHVHGSFKTIFCYDHECLTTKAIFNECNKIWSQDDTHFKHITNIKHSLRSIWISVHLISFNIDNFIFVVIIIVILSVEHSQIYANYIHHIHQMILNQ